jgi:hypothetical protein
MSMSISSSSSSVVAPRRAPPLYSSSSEANARAGPCRWPAWDEGVGCVWGGVAGARVVSPQEAVAWG